MSTTPKDPPGVQLQKRTPGDVVPVLDGELVQQPAPERPHLIGRIIRGRADVVVTTIGASSTAAAAGRGGRQVVRVAWTAGQGFLSWGRRAGAAATHGTIREQIRLARAAGDRDKVAEWSKQLDAEKTARVERMKNLPAVVMSTLMVTGLAVAVLLAVVLLLGISAAATAGPEACAGAPPDSGCWPAGAAWAGWWAGFAGLLGWLSTAARVLLLQVAPLVALPLVALLAWREGRRAGTAPMWLRTAADADDVEIDETTIARALDALRIAQISGHLKAGLPLQFLTPARVDGRGTHAVVRLPAGVPAERIARRRADLATGLHRLAKEVWPTTGAEAGILDLWIADKGALAEGAGPYPLLDDGMVDVFRGVPFGKVLRGTPIVAPVMERNTICGGMPGQGKSSAARVMMVGAALDITAELRIWVPDSNFDFECFRPRCSRYVMGAEDERIEEILEDLRELHREVQIRGELLVRYEIPAVTREYAAKGVGLHPLVCLLEEAHVAIQHAKYGPEIAKLLVDIVRLGRKRGIHLIVSTQAPTKDSMPRDVTRNCSNGIAFAVGDHVANDGLLGQGAYRGGHRATELIPGTDRGIAVVKGFSGERSDTVQAYFLDVEKGNDQVTPIIERSLDALRRAGRPVPGTGPTSAALMVERDLLEDLDAVLGVDPLPSADVPALLSAHAPGWAPYRSLTGKALRARLAERYDIKVPSTGNRWPLDPAAVRAALASRGGGDVTGSAT